MTDRVMPRDVVFKFVARLTANTLAGRPFVPTGELAAYDVMLPGDISDATEAAYRALQES